MRKGDLIVLSWAGKYLFRADNVCWRCVQYFVIASCGLDVCIWRVFVFMSVVVRVCGNVCCVAAFVKDVFFSLGVLKYVCVRDVMDVVFSVCIVRRGAVGASVWGV